MYAQYVCSLVVQSSLPQLRPNSRPPSSGNRRFVASPPAVRCFGSFDSTMASDRLQEGVVQAQVETLDLCESLFPLEGELQLSPITASSLPSLRAYESTTAPPGELHQLPTELIFTINLILTREFDSLDFPLSLSVVLSLSSTSTEPPMAQLTLHQPPWLSRSAHDLLSTSLQSLTAKAEPSSGNSELILDAVERLREQARDALPKEREKSLEKEKEEEWRVWFVLTSLSTREKRDDMVGAGRRTLIISFELRTRAKSTCSQVNWAPEYNLTGFVLAGKPALLVLEGTVKNINTYMNEIKAKSWADIPSFQKKVRLSVPSSPNSRPWPYSFLIPPAALPFTGLRAFSHTHHTRFSTSIYQHGRDHLSHFSRRASRQSRRDGRGQGFSDGEGVGGHVWGGLGDGKLFVDGDRGVKLSKTMRYRYTQL